MIDRTFSFNTEAERTAFIDGVDFVNDSAITLENLTYAAPPGLKDSDGKWIATFQDSDDTGVIS